MNETVKTILVFLCGAVFGAVADIFYQWRERKHSENRLGTDTNIIGQAVERNERATNRVENITDTAQQLADIVSKYKN